jgi:hypothetical protein
VLYKPLLWAGLLGAALTGCGGSVDVDNGSSGGGSDSGPPPLDCGEKGLVCVQFCGSDVVLGAECTASGWQCPDGMINLADCPEGTCSNAPIQCMECKSDVYTCAPDLCIDACPEVMCQSCPPGGEPITTPTCSCSCDAATNQYVCSKAQPSDCCAQDIDCGDRVYAPCVSGVCKESTPMDGCWKSEQCTLGWQCVGAFVCPCGSLCEQEDTPGVCMAPMP